MLLLLGTIKDNIVCKPDMRYSDLPQQTDASPAQVVTNNYYSQNSFRDWLADIINLGFIILVIHALVVSNTSSVMTACGHSIWNYIVVRLCLSFIETAVLVISNFSPIVIIRMATIKGFHIHSLQFYSCTLCIIHIIFIGLGAFYTSDAMKYEYCNSNMTSVSFTQGPLLGIVGYAYVSLDTIIIVASIFVLCTRSYRD